MCLLTCVTYGAERTAYPMFPDPGAGASKVPGGRGWSCGRGVAGMMRRCCWLVTTWGAADVRGLGTTWTRDRKHQASYNRQTGHALEV